MLCARGARVGCYKSRAVERSCFRRVSKCTQPPRLHARFRARPADRFLATWWLTITRSMPSGLGTHIAQHRSSFSLGEKRGPRYGFVTTCAPPLPPRPPQRRHAHPRAHLPLLLLHCSPPPSTHAVASAHMMWPSDLLSPWLWACARHRVGTCESTQPRS